MHFICVNSLKPHKNPKRGETRFSLVRKVRNGIVKRLGQDRTGRGWSQVKGTGYEKLRWERHHGEACGVCGGLVTMPEGVGYRVWRRQTG